MHLQSSGRWGVGLLMLGALLVLSAPSQRPNVYKSCRDLFRCA
jgi:MYXO-CTERM domain-containing protein